MIFKVERLGPVNHAEIDLSKNLILLTGPNGTGKTYVAWAVYGLLRFWRSPRAELPVLTALQEEVLVPAIDFCFERGKNEIELSAIIREHGRQILNDFLGIYTSQLADEFATNPVLFQDTALHLDVNEDSWLATWSTSRMSTLAAPRLWFFVVKKPASSTVFFSVSDRNVKDELDALIHTGFPPGNLIPLDQLTQEARTRFHSYVVDFIAETMIMGWPHPAPIIFPAERIATTIFSRELSLHRTELVDEVLVMQDQPEKALQEIRSRAQRYPRPIRDSLQMAGDLEYWSRQTSEFADLANYLEQHLLRGKVRVSEYGELAFAPDQRSDVTLGLHITASMVKSLSLLVFYLRHRARKGDFVIIDEPELNLHPDNQRLIARVLARAVNRGLKIMASTHSDYLMRALNNLIMLGQDTEPVKALRQKHGYEEAELLKPSQLGVYLFRDNTAEAVPVDETGFSIATIDSEIDRLNAVSQEIYATLFEQEPE